MKRQILISLILLSSVLTMNAQWDGTNPVWTNSNVGIGIAQPSCNLHINNPVGQSVVRLSSNNVKYGALLQFERFNSNGNFFAFETGAGSNDDLRLYVNNNWTIPLVIYKTNGTVGIGTANPDPAYKLDVLGTIRAREIKVDLNGADFVFENDYKLMPLNELEKFVKEQKHLPEVAPAKEMKENGTDLGNLNSKLLQKMEEMTLYMIEQNKKIEELKQAVKLQSEEVEKLKDASK